MNIAEQLKAQWATQVAKKPLSVDKLAQRLDPPHTSQTGFGSKTYAFTDGSKLRVTGRGKHYMLEVFAPSEQQAA